MPTVVENKDKRRRSNPDYAGYPKCLIGISPELREIILMSQLHNGTTGKIQHYVNDTLVPCHIKLIRHYQDMTGRMWTMEDIVNDIINNN